MRLKPRPYSVHDLKAGREQVEFVHSFHVQFCKRLQKFNAVTPHWRQRSNNMQLSISNVNTVLYKVSRMIKKLVYTKLKYNSHTFKLFALVKISIFASSAELQCPHQIDYMNCCNDSSAINPFSASCCKLLLFVGFSAILVYPTIFNFWHFGALALSPGRQSARMSKIKNSGLDQYSKV